MRTFIDTGQGRNATHEAIENQNALSIAVTTAAGTDAGAALKARDTFFMA